MVLLVGNIKFPGTVGIYQENLVLELKKIYRNHKFFGNVLQRESTPVSDLQTPEGN